MPDDPAVPDEDEAAVEDVPHPGPGQLDVFGGEVE